MNFEHPIKAKVTDFNPDKRNANKGNDRGREVLRASLEKLGAGRSILVDSKNNVIAGNKTREAAIALGLEDAIVVETDGTQLVVVKRTDLDLEQDAAAKELAIADNRASELGLEWDAEILGEIAEEIDLSQYFLDDELGDLLAALSEEPPYEPPSNEEDEENTSDLIDKAESGELECRVQLGEIWQLGRHRIACGDSTDERNVRTLLGDRVCDICFTSPPYNLGSSVGLRNGAFKGKKSAYNYEDNISSQSYLDLLNGFLKCAFIASRYQFVNIQSLSANKFDLFSWVGNHSDHLSDVLIWSKTNPQPAMAEKVCNSAFEFVFVFSSELKPKRSIESAVFPRGTFSNVYSSSVGSNSHTDGSHGATFPVEFAQHYLGAYTDGSSLIYEPFLGSGTTIIAAQQMEGDRTVYGFELSPEYCTVILNRWEKFTGGVAQLAGHLKPG